MTLALFFGGHLVALGPQLALFFMLVAKNHQMTILSIGSAFFWLVGITLASLIWFIASPIQSLVVFHVIVSCLFQELARLLFYYLYTKAEAVLRPSDSSLSNRLLAALASGIGSGIMYTFVMYSSVLWKATGPGTLFSAACPGINLFVINAFMALFFGILHISLSILSFEAYRQLKTRKGLLILGFVVFCHLAASLSSMLNQTGGSCIGALSLTFVFTLLAASAAAVSVHRALIHHIR